MDMNFTPELSLESPIYAGIEEEIIESQVDDAIEYIHNNYEEPISSNIMSEVLEKFDIEYFDLPRYLINRLDEIDVY
ncbi:MAG TPA: hypothetical protein DCW90_17855 [Lachnospiraceae bacterium]|nr:hypothetical protein [Lachnospiraceae bacterium]